MYFRHRQPYKIKYSQNFLHSNKTIESLVAQMDFSQKDIVVEIGPGKGQLTKYLLAKAKFVLAIEKDPALSKKLISTFHNNDNFLCINADFLNWDLPLTDFKVVGNIPFAHTAEIMRKLVNHQSPPSESYLIMQYEAARDFVGIDKEFLFPLLNKPQFSFELLSKISKNEFVPRPKVDAALLKLAKRQIPLLSSEEERRYQNFIKSIFDSYEPNALSALKKLLTKDQIISLSRKLSIDLSKRRSNIKFEEWVKIFKIVDEQTHR